MDRGVKSFVHRQRRLTKRQSQAIELLLPCFGVNYQENGWLDFGRVFGRLAPVVLEIGFGMGYSLIEMAKCNPDKNYLGIEVHKPGVGACLVAIEEENLTNIRIIHYDAVDVLRTMVFDSSLTSLQLFFPDPWPKTSHYKRRIVQPPFVSLVAQKLVPKGLFHIATDWEDYANYILAIMSESPDFTTVLAAKDSKPRPSSRPATKFELRGMGLGHSVWDLIFCRN